MFKLNLAVADNYINGQFVPPKSGNYLDIISPHDSAIIGKVALSNHEDISNAVEMAKKAFEKWSYCTVKERVKYLLHLRHIIEENENELAEIIMKEHGKNKSEALAEIRKGNETVEYACSMPQLICGKVLEVSNGVECKEYRMPHGVVASIVPFNFPMMVPMWTMPIAIALGNCFILKPSEKVPLTMNKFCDYVKKAGFPDGVFQIINGTSDAVLGLCDHPDIKAISFVGSSKVANIVSNRCSIQNPPKKVLALGGAKNHLVAVPDCDIDMTSTDVVNSFCGCSGQRCMAASVLLLIGEQKELIDSICKKASELQIGNGPRDLGPLIDKNAVQRVHDYINLAEKDGHKILVDGRSWTNKFEKGNWIGPTVILFNNSSHNAMKDEIFGPLLSIYVCKDNHEAIKIENDNPYGNAGCVYTSTGEQAEWFTKRFSAGMIGINIGVPVPREPFAFGGINNSKFGSYDITADGGTEFWTWRKKVTTKWVPPKKENMDGLNH